MLTTMGPAKVPEGTHSLPMTCIGTEPDRRSHLGPAPVEAPPAWRCVLDGHQDGTTPLTPDAYTLKEPQHDEQYGGEDAYLLEGRQQPNQERRHPHDEQREHEHRLAADPVPVVTEDYAPYRSGEEADPVRSEGQQGPL